MFLLVGVLASCFGGAIGGPGVSPARAADPLPTQLSDAGLYANILTKQIAPGLEPYEPQYPLWTDGATKSRWIYLPPGQVIDTSNPDRWNFPVGTRLWKEFSFSENGTGPLKRVETRVIEKIGPEQWQYGSYVWNADETQAQLAPRGGVRNHFPIAGGVRHDIPAVPMCTRCHAQGGDPVLSFQALQLSDDRTTKVAPGFLTLASLVKRRLLSHPPEKMPVIFSSVPRGRAAMGYLHANCGNCHNPTGAAMFTGLFLQHQIAGVSQESDEPVMRTAVNQPSTGFEIPGADQTFLIRPRDLERSAVYYRLGSLQPGDRMPPLGTKLRDESGLALIRDWIMSL